MEIMQKQAISGIRCPNEGFFRQLNRSTDRAIPDLPRESRYVSQLLLRALPRERRDVSQLLLQVLPSQHGLGRGRLHRRIGRWHFEDDQEHHCEAADQQEPRPET